MAFDLELCPEFSVICTNETLVIRDDFAYIHSLFLSSILPLFSMMRLEFRDEVTASLATHVPLAISHISRRTQHSRHQHHVCKRDPGCSLRPAEVLVAVGGHAVPFYDGGILVDNAVVVARHIEGFGGLIDRGRVVGVATGSLNLREVEL